MAGVKCTDLVLLDLFSGIGGFAEGLAKAGFSFKQHYFSEIDQYAISNYKYNFKNAHYVGAVEDIKEKQIQKPNVITFGSPCQDISMAGKRNGIRGDKSRLFFEAIKVIDACRPDLFIFENVKGLLSSNEGKDFEVVLQSFAGLGIYDIQWQLLNTAWFLPQNRERIYLVGTTRNKPRPEVFPIGKSHKTSGKSFQNLMEANISSAIHTRIGADSTAAPYIFTFAEDDRKLNESFCNNQESVTARRLCIIQNAKTIRRLTPLECERLQGFQDGWTKYGFFNVRIETISNHHRYRLIGNAVSVPVAKAVGLKLRGIEIIDLPDNLGHTPRQIITDIAGIERIYHDFNRDYLRTKGMALRLRLGLNRLTN